MTAEQAISAGLLTELMTVVEQPEDPEAEPIIPPKLECEYKLSDARDENGKFTGYEFVIKQKNLTAKSISGEFKNTEEIIKFGREMEKAGAKMEFDEEESASGFEKYTAKEAIEKKSIFYVRYSKTKVEGSFEVSEGIVKIKQKPFLIDGNPGIFATPEDLFEFIEKSLNDLWFFDQVKKMYTRQGYALKNKENMSECALERNRNFWANPERYCQEDRSKFFGGRIFKFGKMR